MIIRIIFLTFILTTVSMIPSKAIYAETLMGKILDKRGTPVPGVKVILYHPIPGESSPQFTDYDGIFYFSFVSFQRGPYDLEFYWRGKLIFRSSITVRGHMQLEPIRLE